MTTTPPLLFPKRGGRATPPPPPRPTGDVPPPPPHQRGGGRTTTPPPLDPVLKRTRTTHRIALIQEEVDMSQSPPPPFRFQAYYSLLMPRQGKEGKAAQATEPKSRGRGVICGGGAGREGVGLLWRGGWWCGLIGQGKLGGGWWSPPDLNDCPPPF